MDVTNTLNAVFAVISLVAGGLAALQYGTLKALRDSNADLRLRDADREVKMSELTAKIAVLEADRDALARTVRGDDHLDLITTKLDEHHEEAKKHWARDEQLLSDVAAALSTGGTA